MTPSLLRASHEVKLMTVNGIVWVNNAKKVFVMVRVTLCIVALSLCNNIEKPAGQGAK